jgi:uncharacterized membrane protein (UPF0182 family)
VDAYSGAVTLYAFGEDPLRDAWAALYPNTLQAASKTPPELAEHFRYPASLFAQQAEIFAAWHLEDPAAFYNKEDLWSRFKAGSGKGSLDPSYHLLTLPGTTEPAYALVLPYSAPNKDNMVALLAANSDPGRYGELTAYRLSREHITLGPNQILARIKQDPVIAPQIALWEQAGNTVMYGDMLILPVENSMTYVQPLFLKAQKAAITELAGVVVATEDTLRMGKTSEEALAQTPR